MLPSDLIFLIGREECEKLLREAAQARLIQSARLQLSYEGKTYWCVAMLFAKMQHWAKFKLQSNCQALPVNPLTVQEACTCCC